MLGGTLSTSPAQFTTIVASMFVNKTKTTLRAHTVDKNTSSVCRSKRRFRPKRTRPRIIDHGCYGRITLVLLFAGLFYLVGPQEQY